MKAQHLYRMLALVLILGSLAWTPEAQAQHQGKLRFGTIYKRGDYFKVQLNASPGQILWIRADPNGQSRLDPYVEVYNPYNELVAWDDDSGGGTSALISYAVEEKGTYTVYLSSPAGTTGAFRLAYLSADLIPKRIWYAGHVDSHRFYGEKGETVLIMASGDEQLDPQIALLAPNGKLLTWDDDSAGGRDAGILWILPVSGNYTVQVTGTNGTSGWYTLIWLS